MRVTNIWSGGQTGADMGGLLAGETLGIPTSGFAAKGFRTEYGLNSELGTRFNLEDCGIFNYLHHTSLNVHRSDGTVIFGKTSEAGTRRTLEFCEQYSKQVTVQISNDIEYFRNWLLEFNVHVLNVAGNRESKNPGIELRVTNFLISALKGWNDEN